MFNLFRQQQNFAGYIMEAREKRHAENGNGKHENIEISWIE